MLSILITNLYNFVNCDLKLLAPFIYITIFGIIYINIILF
jgi:hypothetical protein